MPLPHFLMLIVAVILAAGLSLVLAVSAGVPLPVLALGAVIAALVAHFMARSGDGMDNMDGGPHHTPGA